MLTLGNSNIYAIKNILIFNNIFNYTYLIIFKVIITDKLQLYFYKVYKENIIYNKIIKDLAALIKYKL